MFKKLMLCMATGTLLLSSCASDEPVVNTTDDGNVTFTAVIPGGINSRAISDGTTANKLTYAVYDENGNELTSLTNTVDINLKTTVSLNLVSGKTYTVVFWAQADGAPYSINTTDGTITVTETGASQAENRDAFFAVRQFTVNGAVTETVELTRPFAQVNVLTTDLQQFTDAGGTITNAGLKVTAPTVLNLKDGSVSGEKEYTLANAAFPDAGETLPYSVEGKTTTWLVTDYILVGESKEAIDITWTSDINVPSRQSITYTGVPVQRNYRTNIYGALLTDQYDYNVIITPDYEVEPGYNYGVAPWDGKTVTLPVIDEATKSATVSTPAELQGLAALTTGENAKNFEGYTFYLDNDIDFGGHAITPIASGAGRSGGNATGDVFKGVIDGQGHTIKNVKIDNSTNDIYTGFIANLAGANAVVKNLTFKNINLSAPNCEAVALIALVSEGSTVENVTIESGKISGKQGVGGIAGRMLKNGHIKNCTNRASVTCTTNNVGGIVGTAYYTQTGVAMQIEGCNNYGDVHSGNVSAGGIVGFSASDITNCKNYGNISADNNSCGGIAGGQNARGVISDCVNYGNINSTAHSAGFGGIIGWIRYETNKTNYPNQSVIEVRNCENNGVVSAHGTSGTSSYGVAGIVGLVYQNAIISGCVNKSTKLSADNMVAGITVYQNTGNLCPNTTPHLTVQNCESSTNVDTQMFGMLKGEIVYDNTKGAFTTLTNNKYTAQ